MVIILGIFWQCWTHRQPGVTDISREVAKHLPNRSGDPMPTRWPVWLLLPLAALGDGRLSPGLSGRDGVHFGIRSHALWRNSLTTLALARAVRGVGAAGLAQASRRHERAG
jgi:hypothetical protein